MLIPHTSFSFADHFFVFVFLLSVNFVGSVSVDGLRSFGTAKKGIGLHLKEETTLFDHTLQSPGHAVMRIAWFTGELLWEGFPRTRIRYYVDGETEPSLDYPLYLAHGIGFDDRMPLETPWGTRFVGKQAFNGGVYNTFPVPFSSSIRITATLDSSETKSRSFYFMCRGLEGYPTFLPGSEIELPPSARLHVSMRSQTLNPIEWMGLLNVTSSSGALVFIVQQVASKNAHCLEGTHIAIVDNDAANPFVLSSGFEDFYLSGQYFDAGMFQSDLSGLTFEDHLIEPNRLSAYRVLAGVDTVLWTKSIQVSWQNGRHSSGELAAGETEATSLVLYYAW